MKFFPGEARDLIVKEYFGNAYSKCKAKEDFFYNEIQKFFRKNFGRELTKEDIIFAVIKNLGNDSTNIAPSSLKQLTKPPLKGALNSLFNFNIGEIFEFGDESLITGVKYKENGEIKVKKIITDKEGKVKFEEKEGALSKRSIIIIAALVLTVLVVVVLAIIFSTVKDSNKYEKSKDEKGGSKSGSSQNQGDNANIQETVDFEQKLDGKSPDPKVKGASLATEIAKKGAITILGSAIGPLVANVCSSVQKNGPPKSEEKRKVTPMGKRKYVRLMRKVNI